MTVWYTDTRGNYPGPDGERYPLLRVVDYDGSLRIEMLWAPAGANAVVAYHTGPNDVAQVEELRDALTAWLSQVVRS